MRPNEFRQTMIAALFALLIGLLLIAGIFIAAPSKADGFLTPAEESAGDALGDSICNYLDSSGVNTPSLMFLVRTIFRSPAILTPGDAVDVINYAVENYCPGHWSELVAYGEGARGI